MTDERCNICRQGRFCVTHGAIADIDDLEKLWAVIRSKLAYNMDGSNRVTARRILIRRLRHPEVGAEPQHVNPEYVHPTVPGRMPRLSSPPCQCGDTMRSHDQDTGECTLCHCPMFARAS